MGHTEPCGESLGRSTLNLELLGLGEAESKILKGLHQDKVELENLQPPAKEKEDCFSPIGNKIGLDPLENQEPYSCALEPASEKLTVYLLYAPSCSEEATTHFLEASHCSTGLSWNGEDFPNTYVIPMMK